MELESDCLVAIQAIQSQVEMVFPFGRVVKECRGLLKSLNTVVVVFVKRSANMAAHCLARMSYSHPDWIFDGENTPVEIKNVVSSDIPI